MIRKNYQTDLCVVGGGLSGLCTAIAAARHGIKVVLIQDRAVLGGNASSEIRMWICGAHGKDNRETGIVEELTLENFYLNRQGSYAVWDSVLYGKAIYQENLTVLLNSAVFDAETDNGIIKSVTAWQSNAETFHTVTAKYFADCSGDSILAPLSNAEYRYGRESRKEFNENIAPEVADKKTMGMSCLIQLRETREKTEFIKPDWAYTFETDADLPFKDHLIKNKDGKIIKNNFWWIEIGGEWDCIHDTDRCREECLKIAYGVWDHMKNKGEHGVENWNLEWIGFLPGKRESRRYVGEYIVTQNDVEAGGNFEDTVAYAGWTMDDHFPAGFYYKDGHPTIYHPAPSPWGLPLRCMISKNIKNLVFAGRNISVTHTSLSSSRVMATCAVLGQALGTAVAQALNDKTDIRNVDINKLQNTLMTDDCFIPNKKREISGICKNAFCSDDVVRDGIDRGEEHCWIGVTGDSLKYNFDTDTEIKKIYITFDSDLNRKSHNMHCLYPLEKTEGFLPETLIKRYSLIGTSSSGEKFEINVDNSHQRFVTHNVNWKIKTLELIPKETHGVKEFRVFRFEFE